MAIVERGDRKYEITIYMGKKANGKVFKRSERVDLSHLTKSKAEKKIKEMEVDFERRVKCLNMEDMRFADYTRMWLSEYAEKKYRKMSLCSAQRDIDRLFLPAFGHLRLSQITPMHIQKFYNSLLGFTETAPNGYATNTIQKVARQLSPIFSQAVRWKIITENPCTGIAIPRNPKNVRRDRNYFTAEESVRFFQYIQKEKLRYIAGAYLAAVGSMRSEEIGALEECDFNFDSGTVTINRTVKRPSDGSGILIEDEGKSQQALRTVSLPPSVMALVKSIFIENKKKRLAIGTKWNGEEHMYLLSTWNGRIASPDTLTHWFTKILREYNLCHEEKLPPITLHGLRHTSATLLIANGVDVKTVQERLGHAKAKTTMDTYVHALQSTDQHAANVLENIISPESSANVRQIKKDNV